MMGASKPRPHGLCLLCLCLEIISVLADVGVDGGHGLALHGLVSGAEAVRQCFEPRCYAKPYPFLD